MTPITTSFSNSAASSLRGISTSAVAKTSAAAQTSAVASSGSYDSTSSNDSSPGLPGMIISLIVCVGICAAVAFAGVMSNRQKTKVTN